jgi:membrane protease YdiL (CAAX protease family)
MKILRQVSPTRSAAEPKYAKSRQTGIHPRTPRGIGTPGLAPVEVVCFSMLAMTNDPEDTPPDKPPGTPPARNPFAPPNGSDDGASDNAVVPVTPITEPPAPWVKPPTPLVEPPPDASVVGHHAPMAYQPAPGPVPVPRNTDADGHGAAAPYNPYGPPPGSAPFGPGSGPEAGPSTGPNAQQPYAAVPPQAYWPQAGYAPPPEPPFPGVLWFSLLVLIGFFGQIVVGAGAVMVLLAIERPNITPANAQDVMKHLPVAGFMAVLLLASLTWPAVALVTARVKKMLNRDTFRIRWPGLGVLGLSTVLGLALVPLALLLESLVARVVPRGDNVIVTVMARGPGVLALTLLGLTLVVAAPVGEELLFRGLGYRGIERRYGLGLGALAISFIFAAVHMNATGFLALFMVSMALCWVTTKTGSLLPAILLHAAYNGVQFLMILASDITPEMAKTAAKSTDLGLPLWMFPAGLVVSLACLFAIGKLSGERRAVD